MRSIQTNNGPISCGDTQRADRRVRINGRPIVIVGDLSEGHEGFPPTPAIEGHKSVLVNGVPIVCFGDRYANHSNGSATHTDRRAVEVTGVRAG